MLVTTRPSEDYNDNDWDVFKTWLKGVLSVTTATVTFTKKDGTLREMTCTLRDDMLPKQELTETKTERKKSETSIPVYDLDKKEWRSFTIRSVKEFTFEVDYGETIPHIS